MSNSKIIEILYDFAEILMTAVIAVGIVFAFFAKTSIVQGESMEKTLHSGDTLVITAINNSIDYGDVVVISQPNVLNKVLIKRVIATGGQTITLDAQTEKVFVDGVELDEPYIKEPMLFSYMSSGSATVPEGKLFVMGDNRNNSTDSRDIRVGFIDERYVVGKVVYRIGDKAIFEKDNFNYGR